MRRADELVVATLVMGRPGGRGRGHGCAVDMVMVAVSSVVIVVIQVCVVKIGTHTII